MARHSLDGRGYGNTITERRVSPRSIASKAASASSKAISRDTTLSRSSSPLRCQLASRGKSLEGRQSAVPTYPQ